MLAEVRITYWPNYYIVVLNEREDNEAVLFKKIFLAVTNKHKVRMHGRLTFSKSDS